MNWGKGIAIFLTLFIAFITTLAVILIRADANLVSEDYYLKEIQYEDEIIAMQHAKDVGAKLIQEISSDGVLITLKHDEQPEHMLVQLLRGNDPSQDLSFKASGKSLFIERSQLQTGKYYLTVFWKINDKPYQINEELWVTP